MDKDLVKKNSYLVAELAALLIPAIENARMSEGLKETPAHPDQLFKKVIATNIDTIVKMVKHHSNVKATLSQLERSAQNLEDFCKMKEELEYEIKKETERCNFWEKSAKQSGEGYQTKIKELEEAHAIIGRLTHQLSKRWDTAPLTKYMQGLLP